MSVSENLSQTMKSAAQSTNKSVMHYVSSENFDVNKVHLGKPTEMELKNGKTILATYFGYNYGDDTTKDIKLLYLLTTPKLICKYHLSDYEGNGKYTLQLIQPSNSTEPEYKTLFDKLFNLDEKIVDFGVEHSEIVFNKDYDEEQREIVKELYKGCIKRNFNKDDKSKEESPSISVKIPIDYATKMPNNNLEIYYQPLSGNKEKITDLSWDNLKSKLRAGTPVKASIYPTVSCIGGSISCKFSLNSLCFYEQEKRNQ